jgi:hypothetical protein
MESNRKQYRLIANPRRGQTGITVIGFLILAVLFGFVGLGALKVVPLYMKNLRLDTVLDDVEREYNIAGRTPTDIRLELNKRFAVEGLRVPRENVTITQGRDEYKVRVQMENRAPYLADVWFLVAYDKEIEITR